MLAEPVGGKTCGDIKTRLTGGNEEENAACDYRAQHLRNHIWNDLFSRKPATGPQTNRHCRVKVTTGYVPDGESHGHHGQSKGQGYTQETDAQTGESGGQNRTAAPA